MNYCPKCGTEAEGMKYCPKCGFNLNEKNIDELREQLIGENASHYMPVFEKLDRENRGGWNWCAFFFTAVWYAYRKMYGMVILIILSQFLLGFVGGLVIGLGGGSAETIELFCYILLIVLRFVFAGIANRMYKKKIDSLIANMPEDEVLQKAYIQKESGTSMIGLIIVIVVMAGINIITNIA